MIAFAVLALFLLWHVNYDYMEIVGFRTNPWGFDSLAYKLIKEIATENNYSHHSTNFWWSSTQAIPILLSWGLRKLLGKCIAFASTAVKVLYSKV